MALTDLLPEQLQELLGGREVRSYPAVLATEPVAMAWARQGAASGAVVVADYQASARGHGGWPWPVHRGEGLGFSLVVRPELPPEREGWPYVPALLGLADALTPAARLSWPDTVSAVGSVVARLGVYVELGPSGAQWATVTALVEPATPPRGPLLARVLTAVEARLAAPTEQVLADYRERCSTLGRRVRARLVPLGPGGPEVTGTAVDVLADGALVLRTDGGSRVAVPPHTLALLDDPAGPDDVTPLDGSAGLDGSPEPGGPADRPPGPSDVS